MKTMMERIKEQTAELVWGLIKRTLQGKSSIMREIFNQPVGWECEDCNGSGQGYKSDSKCPTCQGTGKLGAWVVELNYIDDYHDGKPVKPGTIERPCTLGEWITRKSVVEFIWDYGIGSGAHKINYKTLGGKEIKVYK